MIYLLTPTGDRPECFALLSEYIAAQTYAEPMTWIIVDDGDVKTRIHRMPANIEICTVYPPWRSSKDGNTQARNMVAGMKDVPADASLLIMEDDDVYLPGHIENIVAALVSHNLVGERVSCYYNVATGRHRTLRGSAHASMASVGARGDALAMLRAICVAQTSALDITLWRRFGGAKKLLDTQNVVGVKGMPGRGGIGIGHRQFFGTADQDDMLAQWIGKDRAEAYTPFRRLA